MSRLRSYWVLVCFLLCNALPSLAQDYLYNVKQWELEDGLLHRLVHVVHEDHQGFIWIGTENGIQRFDGHEFKSYESTDPQKSTVRITKIGEDDGNWLWLWDKSRDEFSFLNTVTEKMESEEDHFGSDFPIHSIEKNGRWIYNEEHIPQTKDGRLVFVLSNPCEIVTYNTKQGFTRQPIDKQNLGVLRHVDADDNLWITRDKNSISKINLKGQVIAHFTLPEFMSVGSFNNDEGSVSFSVSTIASTSRYFQIENHLLSVVEVSADKQYFGKYKWYLKNDEWSAYTNNQILAQIDGSEYKECLYTSVQDVLEDSKGRLWVGSGFGLSVVVVRKGNFEKRLNGNITPSNNNNYSLRGITQYNGALAAQIEGLPLMQVQGSQVSVLSEVEKGIPLLLTTKGVLVSGNINSIVLKYLDGKEDIVHLETIGASEKAIAWSLAESKEGIWMGTSLGLAFYDYENKTLKRVNFVFPESKNWIGFKEIYHIHIANKNELWLSAETGFYVVNPIDRIIKSHWYKGSTTHYMPFDIVYHQYIDGDGIVWLATNNGLVKWQFQSEDYEVFNQQDGFSNNTIYAVYEDEYEHLWMSSDYGIIRFQKKSFLVSNYVTKHGITHNEFNRSSHFKGDDGIIFFGGLDGVTAVDPSVFQEANTQMSPLLLSDFSVYNGDNAQIESKIGEVRQHREIDVLPHYRYVNLKFAMPTYEDDNLNKYAWKIDELDADWQIQTDNKLQLGKLPYGSHTLLVKGSNSGTGWSDNRLSIRLHVLKPFYLQNWFLILLSGLAIFSIVVFFRYKTRELKANELKLQAKVAEATETIQKDKELIQQQADDLQEMDKVKSRFFTNVSHELRTPLTLILGPLEQLLSKKDSPLPSHIENKLKLSLSNSIKLKSRVDELLDLSKLDGKELKLNLAPVDVAVVLQSAVEAFRVLAENQGVGLELNNLAVNEPYALIDEERFVKVVDNLLSNALKHSPPKGKISVELRKDGGRYLVKVSDQGKGIKEEERDAIFRRFYQTTDGEVAGGTGIGLSLSKNIAELMGGGLYLDVDYVYGASFVFQFAAIQAENQLTEHIALEDKPSKVPVPSLLKARKINLLLVEDNLELRAYVRSIVENDFIIHESGDGLAALALLEKQHIDIIVSDIMMPNMNGVSLVKELKKTGRDKIPIIMLSAKSGQMDIVSLLEMGVDDYIVKPFYARELLARLHNQVKNLEVRLQASTKNIREETESYTEKLRNELRAYVLDNIADVNFSVLQVIEHLNTTERTLNRKLSKELGLSCAAYIKEIRLQKAQEHLQNRTYASVKEVSVVVGFKRADYFAKEFYKRYGKYPSEY